MNIKYTKEILEVAVAASYNVVGVMDKLNVKYSGGNHRHISSRILYFGIDTSHFDRYKLCREASTRRKINSDDTLVLRERGNRQEAYRLRRALIEKGIKYTCSICNILPVWNSKELRLQVDHINGNFLDDRIENLRFLCPNCHSQTDGYCGSKGKTTLTKGNPNIPLEIKQKNWSKDKVSTRKVMRPSKEILEQEVNNNSFLELGRKYGVSDNAIRKWCKRYGIEWRKRKPSPNIY